MCGEVPPKSLENLKRALPQANVHFQATLFSLKIADADDVLTKLKKEKFNAALARLPHVTVIPVGRTPIDWDTVTAKFLEGSRQLVDAALDLDDPKLAMRTLDAHVNLMEHAFKRAEEKYKWAEMSPDNYFAIRYQYFDAQILQLRYKKKLQAK